MNKNINLKICDEKHFFDLLEKCVEFRIPSQLRNILTLNLCNSAIALSRNIGQSIHEIELFMQNKFHKGMLKNNKKMDDYLGVFVTRQKNFQFLSGQTQMLNVIHNYCRKLYNVDDIEKSDDGTPTSTATSTATSTPFDALRDSNDASSSHSKGVVTTQPQQSNSLSNEDSNILIKKMFDGLYKWMTNQDFLEEAMKNFVSFFLLPESLVTRDDGSVSYTVKCPFRPCLREYVVTYKRYSSYYVLKKGEKSSNVKKPKWNFMKIQMHFQRDHSNIIENPDVDVNSSNDDSDDVPLINLTSNRSLIDSDEDDAASNVSNVANVRDEINASTNITKEVGIETERRYPRRKR